MTRDQVIVNERRSLLIYAQRNGVSQACRVFGLSRTSFYKIKTQYIKTGSLAPKIRRRPKMPTEMALSKKKLLLQFVQEHPTWGPQRYAYCFQERGISVTSVTLWHHLRRFGLNRRYQRLVYLERAQADSQPLTERKIREIKRQINKVNEGLWPGHIVALDTFYVGSLKRVGRIYQVSGIDLCSRYGWAKLYLRKDQSSTIDLVENVLIPKFYDNGISIESVLTDNGTEFTGGRFKQMLSAYEIKHIRIPPGKPILNGTCERFQRTILEEFYQPTFRTRFFGSLPELQQALDKYLCYYNFQRPHFGVSQIGTIPIEVFKSKHNALRQQFQKLLT
jgi:transposase InsO family protein